MSNETVKVGRGGKRKGAGRPAGSFGYPTCKQLIVPMPLVEAIQILIDQFKAQHKALYLLRGR